MVIVTQESYDSVLVGNGMYTNRYRLRWQKDYSLSFIFSSTECATDRELTCSHNVTTRATMDGDACGHTQHILYTVLAVPGVQLVGCHIAAGDTDWRLLGCSVNSDMLQRRRTEPRRSRPTGAIWRWLVVVALLRWRKSTSSGAQISISVTSLLGGRGGGRVATYWLTLLSNVNCRSLWRNDYLTSVTPPLSFIFRSRKNAQFLNDNRSGNGVRHVDEVDYVEPG